MSKVLLIVNDTHYGSEQPYNAFLLAGAFTTRESIIFRVFLIADGARCAKNLQKVLEGYYKIQLIIANIIRKDEVMHCGTFMNARGPGESEQIDGARRWTLAALAYWTLDTEKVLVF